ncbi:mechanosensitive ion channel family protein [Bradyrhizobium sp. SYSU BS000235]|uniref:mechanosensitive ion channel family protein n=1 Tax=Bradyrhizobium sp. SYSU BS000235 TaxID=3411332 RepID=UPI003C78A8F5
MPWANIHDLFSGIIRAIRADVSSPWFYAQFGIILAGMGLALGFATAVRGNMASGALARTVEWPLSLRLILRALLRHAGILIFALLMGLCHVIMAHAAVPSYLIAAAASLATAWLAVRMAASLIRNDFLVRIISIVAWLLAVLGIFGLLQPASDALDSVSIMLGTLRLTPLLVIKVVVFLGLALWASNILSNFLETRINHSRDLTPSIQVLLTKIVRLALMVLAVAIVMSAAGIDLSVFALFSGAVGVGLGFGLQKIVGNFISGMILLADKSVKPGDLITVDDSSGRVNAMNTRYISVAAGDGRVFLIPNEDLITKKVVNWTYTDSSTQLKVNFSTTYDADPNLVCRLATEIASATPRVIPLKPPSCLLTDFAETGMKFSLTFWIADPDAGMDNVRSDVLLALWDAFKRANIHAPYPVREIRLQSGALPVAPVHEARD